MGLHMADAGAHKQKGAGRGSGLQGGRRSGWLLGVMWCCGGTGSDGAVWHGGVMKEVGWRSMVGGDMPGGWLSL